MIELYCQHCGQRMEIADQYAGQTGSCKNCGEEIVVPASASESPPKTVARAHSATVPYKWIGAAVGVLGVIAIGVYALIGRDSDSPRRQAGPSGEGPLPERTLHFPDDREYGGLGLRDWNAPAGERFNKRPLGAARGIVTVPEGQDLGAVLGQNNSGALLAYASLHENALQSIDIRENYGILPNELEYISHMKGLERIRILDANQQRMDLTLIRGNTNLRVLEIRGAKLTVDDMRALSGFMNLEHLTLWGSNVPSFGLQYLSDKTSLTFLDLTFNPIDDAGIAYLRNLHELETLLFAHDHMSDKGWETLLQFPKLKWLTMTVYTEFDGGWTDQTMKVIAQLQNLERLGIQNHKLTAQGLRQLKDLKSLRDLSIWASVIDADMAQVLSDLTQIEILDLSYSDPSITNEQLTWLQKCRHVKDLNLSQHRDAGDEIVPALSEFTFLRTLWLNKTSISQQGLETLRAALPNTDVRK